MDKVDLDKRYKEIFLSSGMKIFKLLLAVGLIGLLVGKHESDFESVELLYAGACTAWVLYAGFLRAILSVVDGYRMFKEDNKELSDRFKNTVVLNVATSVFLFIIGIPLAAFIYTSFLKTKPELALAAIFVLICVWVTPFVIWFWLIDELGEWTKDLKKNIEFLVRGVIVLLAVGALRFGFSFGRDVRLKNNPCTFGSDILDERLLESAHSTISKLLTAESGFDRNFRLSSLHKFKDWTLARLQVESKERVYLFSKDDPGNSSISYLWSEDSSKRVSQNPGDWLDKNTKNIPEELAQCFISKVTKSRE